MISISEVFENVRSKIGSPTKSDDMAPKRILCVGLCCVDIVQVVDSFPREDSDLRSVELRWMRGGNASNNCSVLSQIGADCEFFGTLARDNQLNFLLDDFKKYNINIENCIYHSDATTPLSTVVIATESGSRTIIHSNLNLPELTIDDFKKLSLKKYAWIHFEGRNITEVLKMMEYVEYYNEQNAADPTFKPIKMSLELEKQKLDLLDLLAYADVTFVGKDFAKMRKCNNMSETLKNLARDVKKGGTIICAWGDNGAMARAGDGTTVQSPAYPPRLVVDTLGAGDTFCAAVISSLSNGKSLEDSLSFGCRIAGGKVGQRGFGSVGLVYKELCGE